ncbi:restriction endonuclease subunit S, partial [Campylobacter sp. RM17709]|nr:restriction endonuclease subunit S [Campylobacter sp. RM17709]
MCQKFTKLFLLKILKIKIFRLQNKMTNLPQGWEVKKLEDIFNIERGGSPRPIKEFLTDKEDGINWIKIGDIKNQKYLYKTEERIIQEGLKKSKLVVEGDLLVSNSMSFGKPVIVKLKKGAIHDGWLLLKEKINLSKEYFYYLFSSNFMYNFLSHRASGSTVKNLNIDKLKQIEVPIPPLKEQERIVGILDESFAKIDESIKILEQDLLNLDELMQSALQKAFNPLKDDIKENYQLPQGWEVKRIGDIVKLKNGFAFKSNLFCNDGIPIIRIKNIQNENVILDDLVFCNPDDYKNNLDNYLIFKNDILIAMSGATTGKIGIYNLNDKAYLNQRIGLLRIDNSILRKYIFWFLYCNSEQNLANAFGAAQPNLNTEQIH